VRENPSISFEAPASTCDTTASIILGGVTPAGGVFTGPGITDGVFFPSSVGIGTYDISYTVTINGCSSTSEQTITVDNCAGINENDLLFIISPNPSNGIVSIKSAIKLDQIQFLSIEGRIVKEINSIQSNSVIINDLIPATYFVVLKAGGLTFHYQLIVQ
jgi:hypothetical protein